MAEGQGSRGDGDMSKEQRTPRRTLRTRRVRRRFRHWKRPEDRPWPDVHEDVAYLTRELGRWHPDTVAPAQGSSSGSATRGGTARPRG